MVDAFMRRPYRTTDQQRTTPRSSAISPRAALNRGATGRPARMSDQQAPDEATPTEDPRETGVADQLPEENPEGQGAGGGERQKRDTDDPDAPDTSPEGGPEGDPGRSTGNPRSAG
jgi:hypothetical protein